MQKQNRIVWLDIARAIAIVSITFNHAVNRSFNIYTEQLSEYLQIPVYLTIIKVILYTFSRIGVPLFLMISGTLLLPRNYSGGGTTRFLKHNWLQLLFTTEIWLTIMFWYKQVLPGSILASDGITVCFLRFIMTLLGLNQITMGSMWYMPMILCVYLMIPVLSISLKELDGRYFLVPISIVVFSSYILPDINGFINALGFQKNFIEAVDSANVFSIFIVYILFGYYIGSKRVLEKLNTRTIVFGLVSSFISFCVFQFWIYTREWDFVVGYSYRSIFPMIVSVCVYELLRRMPEVGEKAKWICTELSKISFGIYFVHICIMEGIDAIIENTGLNITYFHKFLLLESVSFLGSIFTIWIFRRFKWIAKNMFGIKD